MLIRALKRLDRGLPLPQALVTVDHILQRGALAGGHLLRHMRHAPAGGNRQLTTIDLQLPHQQRKQTRFATAIGTDNTDAAARMDGEIGSIQQALGTALQNNFTQGNHDNLLRWLDEIKRPVPIPRA